MRRLLAAFLLSISLPLFAAVLSGRIRDAKTNAPIAGATVAVWQGPTATTGADGMYSLDVPEGTLNLSIKHRDYMTSGDSIRIMPEQKRAVNFALKPLARVSGVVVDEANQPIAAATITPRDALDRGMPDMAANGAMPVSSGPDGKFDARVLPGTNFYLLVAKKALPQVKSEVMKLDVGERKSDVVLTIPAGIVVTGRALDIHGKPLSDVSVVAGPSAGSFGETLDTIMEPLSKDPVRTDADGKFAMRLKEGTYNFWFRRDGYLNKRMAAQRIADNGENVVEARLNPAVEISGRVTRGGAGVADVEVRPDGGVLLGVKTAADGSFTLGGLKPGPTTIEVIKRPEWINEKRIFTAPARDVAIDLQPGGTIRGRVVEKGTMKPIRSFRAGVMLGLGNLSRVTGDDGSFTFEHVPAGATTVAANAFGYEGANRDVTVVAGEIVNDVVLELERGVRLTGKVTDANGAPLSGVFIIISPPQMEGGVIGGMLGGPNWKPAPARVPNTNLTTVTDKNGVYTFEGLTRGDEGVQFSRSGYAKTTRNVTLTGSEVTLDVQLSATPP